MLDILGAIGGNILSLPGILGLALGMMTRNLMLASILGALVGVAETIIFAGFDFAAIDPLEFGIAVAVGIVAGSLGCGLRRKGATV
ncbi:MAG: hypothetical protein AAGL24_29170 [Pseudomonadota bacterium]